MIKIIFNMIRHFFIDSVATIVKGSFENTSLNPIMELNYGNGITRGILRFDEKQIIDLVEDKTFADISKLCCHLKMTNCFSVDGLPYEKVLGAINILHDEGYKNISLSAILPNSLEVEKEFEGMCEKLEVKPEVRCLSKKGRGGKNYALIQRKFEEYVKKKNIRSMYLKKAKLRPT